MSHEIRTPMSGVIGVTELLGGTELSRKQKQYTQTINRSAQALLQIINDVLDISKIEAGGLRFEAVEFDLDEVVDDVVDLLGPEATGKGIELISSVTPRTKTHLIGDPLRLRQILINLVGNAVKFTESGEVTVLVHIAAEQDGDVSVTIEVNDTGVGMKEDTLVRIFDAFSQADESTTRRFGGTGLGLSICKQLVELMGGTMTVASTLEVGSSFRCVIPFRAAEQAANDEDRSRFHGLQVIVATPARSLRDTIAGYLMSADADVILVESARELRFAIDQHRSELGLIIADVDGFEPIALQQATNEVAYSTARIFLSRAPASLSQNEYLRRSTDELVAKPVRWPLMFDTIGRVTGRATEPTMAFSHDTMRRMRLAGRALVVEDNPVNQLVAEGMLRELGCHVSIVADGRAAISRVTTEDFDIVLMDSQMPGMDGLEATRLIREWEGDRKHTPIIGVTAHASDEGRVACLDAGMDEYLSKPYTFGDLAQKLRQWLPIHLEQNTRTVPIITDDDSCQLDDHALRNIRLLQSPERPHLLQEIITVYLQSAGRLMKEIAAAAETSSLERLAGAAHTLKSSSANIGANDFARLAKDLERACDAEDRDAASHIAAAMQRHYPLVVAAVNRQTEALSA